MEKTDLGMNEYQQMAMRTLMPSCDNLSYGVLGITGEVGEICEKIADWAKEGKVMISTTHCDYDVYDKYINQFGEDKEEDDDLEIGLFSSAAENALQSGFIAKMIRKGKLSMHINWRYDLEDDELIRMKKELLKEIGDVQWFCAHLAKELGADLSDVGVMNIDKLSSRKERGVIDGDGDNR